MTLKVEHTITIAAPPERVWQAWVKEINQWWVKPYYSDAELATGLLMEPKLGGHLIEQWGTDGEGFLVGVVIEWLPPRRLAYTWTERGAAGFSTLVEVELAAEGKGTRLTFTHSGFEQYADSQHQRDEHQGGWEDLIDHLKTHVEKR